MELSNRNTLEQQFAGELAELTAEQRSRLRDYLGTPPDPANVPNSFWEEIRRDTQQRVAAIAYLLFIMAAEEHTSSVGSRQPSTSFDTDATTFAMRQGQVMGNGYANATRDRFNAWAQSYRAPITLPSRTGDTPVEPGSIEEFTFDEQELANQIEDVIRNESAERIATTVTTSAQTEGGNAGMRAAKGDNNSNVYGMVLTKYWTNHPELTRTGPCVRCEALHNQPEQNWAAIDADASGGPPLHDYCACTTNYIFTPQTENN